MKPDNAIEVSHITKSFKVFLDKGKTLKELTLFSQRRRFEERQVLKDISFEVKKGQAIGLIGHNGCGKSTTLKLLTRIMYPDSGTIDMRGRVSSLIELGAGFHPDMSGRQNIFTNAAIFGLTRKEIDNRIRSIIEFSELGEFIDNPVRTYSSGMYMRLAFSVAINVDAEILLIDEILAVGDTNFQVKCFDKLREIKKNGTTIVIVSHSLDQIEQICERSIWIHNGRIQKEGMPRDVHSSYLEFMGQQRQDLSVPVMVIEKRINDDINLLDICMKDEHNETKQIIKTEDTVTLAMSYESKVSVDDGEIVVAIYNTNDVKCYETCLKSDENREVRFGGTGSCNLKLIKMPLLPGKYTIDVEMRREGMLTLAHYSKALKFEMYSDSKDSGICRINHEWEIE